MLFHLTFSFITLQLTYTLITLTFIQLVFTHRLPTIRSSIAIKIFLAFYVVYQLVNFNDLRQLR